MRLVGGAESNIGRVEVFFNAQWGPIQYKISTLNAHRLNAVSDGLKGTAQVICRQLGFADVMDFGQVSNFG